MGELCLLFKMLRAITRLQRDHHDNNWPHFDDSLQRPEDTSALSTLAQTSPDKKIREAAQKALDKISKGNNSVTRDNSMSSIQQDKVGGIDLNPKNWDLTEEGSTIDFQWAPEFENRQFESIDGLVPVMGTIITLPSLTPLIGLSQPDQEKQLSQLDLKSRPDAR